MCCLSSLNLEKFDEWKDSTIVEDLIEMLDNVLTQFIDHAPQPALFKATSSALTERSLGLGAMGFHSYLQSKSIPWESAMAVGQNKMMFAYSCCICSSSPVFLMLDSAYRICLRREIQRLSQIA